MCKHVERSQSKRPRLLAIHGRHDNRCISDQICNRSINRTSNLEFLYAVEIRSGSTIQRIDQMRPRPPVLFFFFFFFSALLVFRFRNAVFLFHPDGHILCGRIYFWKRIKQISEGILPKEGDPFASIETFHRIKACIFARKNYQISFVHCTMQSRHVVSYASFFCFPFVEKRADNLIFTM